jgi:predicted enzyme related to lactoylglutathione lyase
MTENAIPESTLLRGMATANYWADDVPAAVAWYTELLGVEPYFRMPQEPATPQYVEFRFGDHQAEFGIIDRQFGPPAGAPGGVVVYWAVDDIEATFDRLLGLGATEFQPITPRGDGDFVTAAVVDPFGNVLGIMKNPHYLEMLGA